MKLYLLLIAISSLSFALAQVGLYTPVPPEDYNSPKIQMGLSFGSYSLVEKIIQENSLNASSITWNIDKLVDVRFRTVENTTYYYYRITYAFIVPYENDNSVIDEYSVPSTIQVKLESGTISVLMSSYSFNWTESFDSSTDIPTSEYYDSSLIKGIIDYGASYVYQNTMSANSWSIEPEQITRKVHGDAVYYEAQVTIMDEFGNSLKSGFGVRVYKGEQSIAFWYDKEIEIAQEENPIEMPEPEMPVEHPEDPVEPPEEPEPPVTEEETVVIPVEEETVTIPEEAVIDDEVSLHIVGLGFPVSASSTYSLQHFNYMLNAQPATSSGSGAWCARQSDSEQWIQVSSIVPMEWEGVSIQGRSDDDMWVTSFNVLYSNDGDTWTGVDNGRVFGGNVDRDSIVTQWFDKRVTARTLRIVPITWETSICLRFDALARE